MDREKLIERAKLLAAARVTPEMDLDERMDILEIAMMELLEVQIMKPPIGRVATATSGGHGATSKRWLMGDDPRLPKMPERPTLMDFYKYRFSHASFGYTHLLQSAGMAKDRGHSEKVILACLLHDISVVGFIRTDHGHWAAQLIAPYVDEEVAWAVKYHQGLRFRPDPDWEYEYPKNYLELFGEDYEPPNYIKKEWDYCKNHKWFGTAMQVIINDVYTYDPERTVVLEEFEDIIARNFRNPEEGLGFDNSPVAHMWRTIIWPNNFL